MKQYSYEDFQTEARKAGMLDRFSEADLALARAKPEAGRSLLSYKKDYAQAVSDEARALANAGAERIRANYGGYTAGESGEGYYLNGTREDDYVNQFAAQQQQMGESIAQGFDGSKAEALWRDYERQYQRQGELAYQNSLAEAAANTGGIASTAAVTAAQQAQGVYASQAAAQKAALYQQAYENWLAGRQSDMQAVQVYEGLHQSAQAQWPQEMPAVTDSAKAHKTVSLGSHSLDVQAMQLYLSQLGYPCATDGLFGGGTQAALRQFQKDYGVYPDGVCGPVTWMALIRAGEGLRK